MDPISDFVLNKSRLGILCGCVYSMRTPTHPYTHIFISHAYISNSHRPVPSEVGLFETCLAYLNSLLKVFPSTVEEE